MKRTDTLRRSARRAPVRRVRPRGGAWAVATWAACLATLGTTACGDDDSSLSNNNNSLVTLTRQQAFEGCLAADACDVMPFLYSSLCLEANWDQQYHTGTVAVWNDIYRCVLSHPGDCPAIRACFGGGADPPACSATTDGTCDGNLRRYCDTFDRKIYTQDCALANQVCLMTEVAVGVVAPICAQGTCVDGVDEAQCSGNLLLTCDQGVRQLRDCAASGLICGDGTTGTKACVGDGVACDSATFTATCADTVVTRCIQNHLDTWDCAQAPGDKTCEAGNDQCVPAGTQCESGQESCQGSTIRVCLDGRIQEVDCLDLGFSSCELRTGGAHCRL